MEQIGLGEFWMTAIVNMINRQRLRDIDLQKWLREMNNDTTKDANQSNKMRTYRLFKTLDNYKMSLPAHQYAAQNVFNKTATKQPQISHRDRTLFETV